jgi:hypothetical protein
MSAPSFLLANETNHALLFSLLNFINAILEHQFTSMLSSLLSLLLFIPFADPQMKYIN